MAGRPLPRHLPRRVLRTAGRALLRGVLPGVLATGLVLAVTVTPAEPATGRSGATTPAASGTQTVTVVQDPTPAGRVERRYVLTVPSGASGPRPLVVALHGRAQTTDALRRLTGLEQLGEREGFVSAFPVGWGGVWNAGTCCAGTSTPDMPDVAFLDQVVADVASRTPVDLSRLYLVGYSNGGMMAYRYACQRSASVAAVAVVSGSMAASPDYADAGEQRCRPDAPVSVVAVHGSADRTVPYAGGEVAGSHGGSVAPVRGGIDQSAVGAGCRTGSTMRSAHWVRLDYTGCAEGAAVRLVVLSGAGHGWTRDRATYGDTTAGIWTFLKPRRAAAG